MSRCLPIGDLLVDADPENLLVCVAKVYERYASEGKLPGSDDWSSDSRTYRPRMIHDVYLEWVTMTQNDKYFPWHDDYVCRMWVQVWRKGRKDFKASVCEELGITCYSNLSKDERSELTNA